MIYSYLHAARHESGHDVTYEIANLDNESKSTNNANSYGDQKTTM
jgi:hypothetical protein